MSLSGAAKRPGGRASCRAPCPRLREEVARGAGADFLQRECGLDRMGAEQAVEYVLAGRAALGAMPSAESRGGRALLRRRRRHAARHSRALRRAHQPRLGTGAAQALLPHLQFRAAGRRHRQRHRHLARRAALLSAGDRLRVSAARNGGRSADPGAAGRRPCSRRAGAGTRRAPWPSRAICGGRKVPPPIQRMRADDLHGGRLSRPGGLRRKPRGRRAHSRSSAGQRDHRQLPARGHGSRWPESLLEAILDGRVATVAIDTPEPSPFSHEILNANPYAFLDDAPLEERRARAVQMRRTLPPDYEAGAGALSPEAIAQVAAEVWPPMRDADELHEALCDFCLLPPVVDREIPFAELVGAGRRRHSSSSTAAISGRPPERADLLRRVYPAATLHPPLNSPERLRRRFPNPRSLRRRNPARLVRMLRSAAGRRIWRAISPCRARWWTRRWRNWKPKARFCAGSSPPRAARSRNGAIAACWRASIA